MSQSLLEELRALYDDADALHRGTSCPTSTECCRFGITGRQPYVTSIETLAVRNALARRGGALSDNRRALPILMSAERERVCPLLDRQQRCSVYEVRPLGCRTYFCERADKGAGPSRPQLREIMREPDVIKKFAEQYSTPMASTPAETHAFIKEEQERWQKVIAAAGIKPE